ncbi:uncharacterized protein EI90DRAFT_1646963 [Cantharellus anzutake]|uniref:uncharacterized protein n=1 Tax=Cantharellus anzutake TaxID=1750568 RepID=UPI001903BBC7|nr:uncharacterized protein EI90DRAFT_1646963 [Cantharellus anzutake]KAF8327934.1 hypothetical protein EI90DRAFT_1646963 [Cantharellus anzutake]
MVFAAPFRNTARYLRYAAHEEPVIFWSLILGFTGPVMVLTVPPMRRQLGYVPPERPPTSYPLPNRLDSPSQDMTTNRRLSVLEWVADVLNKLSRN